MLLCMSMRKFFLHILEQRIGFAQQVKSKLVEYKYEKMLVF